MSVTMWYNTLSKIECRGSLHQHSRPMGAQAGSGGQTGPRIESKPAATAKKTGAAGGGGGGGFERWRRSIWMSLSPGCASSSGGNGRGGGACLLVMPPPDKLPSAMRSCALLPLPATRALWSGPATTSPPSTPAISSTVACISTGNAAGCDTKESEGCCCATGMASCSDTAAREARTAACARWAGAPAGTLP